MARDRKRAKQRQRRRAGRPDGGAPHAAPEKRDDAALESGPAGSGRVEGDENGSPDPLDEVSGEVELAHAAMADPPAANLDADELAAGHDGEALGADDTPAASTRAAGLDATGAELPREGNRFANFLRACAAELRRVQWPDRRQVAQATGVVLGFVIIAGAYLGLLDAVWSRLVNAIL